jgi:ribulose-5-phosphate 4-epimerase/fuculose-1-phosphate aldolase
MPFNPSLDNGPELLAAAARAAGARPDYTQGGGGNVSLKLGGERMLIKASGSKLRDMTARSGYALVNSGNIRRRLLAGPAGDEELTGYIRAQALPVSGVPPADPSVETGFHSLLGGAVIHTHSVYANVLNFSAEAPALLRRILPEAVFVPYHSPGAQLCEALAAYARQSGPQVFFLGNHGLAVAHSAIGPAAELNERVNEALRRGLNLPPFPAGLWAGRGLSPANAAGLARYGRDYLLANILSPDQALYCGPDALDGLAPDTGAVNEVLSALFYVLDCMAGLGLKPRFLSPADLAWFGSLNGGRYGRGGVK